MPLNKFLKIFFLTSFLSLTSQSFAAGALLMRNLRVEPAFACPGQAITAYWETSHPTDTNATVQVQGAISVNDGVWDNPNDYLFIRPGGFGVTAVGPPIPTFTYLSWTDPTYAVNFLGWHESSFATIVPPGIAPGSTATFIVQIMSGGGQWITFAPTTQISLAVEVTCDKAVITNIANMGDHTASGQLIIENNCNSPTPTPTGTSTASPTPSRTRTPTPSPTPTNTPTSTVTATPTSSYTPSSTSTVTHTATRTDTPSPTISVTVPGSPTFTPTITVTSTQTLTATPTPTPSSTSSATTTPSATATTTATITVTVPGTFTFTPTITETSTQTPSSTATQTLSNTPTWTPTHTVTATPSQTPSDTATSTVTYTSSATPTSTNTPINSPTASPTHTPTRTTSPTLTSTSTITATPTSTSTSTASATLTATPTQSASYTVSPTITQTSTVTTTPFEAPYKIKIAVYNSAGERVRVLFDGAAQMTGEKVRLSHDLVVAGESGSEILFPGILRGIPSLVWMGNNDAGQAVNGGQYYVKVETIDPFGKVTAAIHPVGVIKGRAPASLEIFSQSGERVSSIPVFRGEDVVAFSLPEISVSPVYAQGGVMVSGIPINLILRDGSVISRIWDGKASGGEILQSGVYTLRLSREIQGGSAEVSSHNLTLLQNETSRMQSNFTAGPNPIIVEPGERAVLNLFSSPITGRRILVNVYNLAGELAATAEGSSVFAKLSIDLGGAASGIYIAEVKVVSGTGVMSRQLIRFAVSR